LKGLVWLAGVVIECVMGCLLRLGSIIFVFA
jgi:hypothetical protein